MRITQSKGLTLIELLCVISIITILLGLSLGTIMKARRHAEVRLYYAEGWRVFYNSEKRLHDFYQTKTNYPAWTVDELEQNGVFDSNTLKWMQDGLIEYHPFSSADPNGKVVMRFLQDTKALGFASWELMLKSNIVDELPDDGL
jgi:prepilin-type N-terminal cleavage/methylation domain-containing protein